MLYCLFTLLVRTSLVARFFFLMIRRPPRSTLDRSSAASDVYKRQDEGCFNTDAWTFEVEQTTGKERNGEADDNFLYSYWPVSYTHLRAHETVLDLVCRLLLEKKTITVYKISTKITDT